MRTVNIAKTKTVMCECISRAAKVFVVLYFFKWDVSRIYI